MLKAVVLILVLIWTETSSQNNPLPRLIVSDWIFFDSCDFNDPFNSSGIGGVEFNVVRDAFKLAGYVEGQDFMFECLPWPEAQNVVYRENPGDNILGVISGIPINPSDIANGFMYSQGTLQVAYGIGYFQNATSINGIANWFFIRPFTTSLYLMMLVMPMLFAILLWYYEGKNMPFLNYLYHLIVYYFRLDFLKKLNAESRFIEFFFQIYCLVLVITYTSDMVSIISNLKTNGGVQTLSNLRGLQITTIYAYIDYVPIIYGRPVALPDSIQNTFQLPTIDALITSVERQDIPYILFEDPILEALAAAADCRFTVALTNVIQINYGIMWSKYTTQEMKDKIDIAIVEALEERSQSVRIAEGTANATTRKCLNPRVTGSQQILLSDVYGLWVIWSLCLGGAISVRLVSYCKRRNGRPVFDFYDLEIRGSREKALIGAINCETTCLAMVSNEMIRKTREQAVATYNDCFKKLKIPSKLRMELLSMIENDQDFKELIEPIINKSPHHARRSFFGSLTQKIFKRGFYQNEKRPKSIQIPDDTQRSPIASQRSLIASQRSPIASQRANTGRLINSNFQSLKEPSISQNSGDPFSILDMSSKTSNKLQTKLLVTHLSDRLSKFSTNPLHSIHYKLTAQKARDFADYYNKRSIDLIGDLEKLKEERDHFEKNLDKKNSARAGNLKRTKNSTQNWGMKNSTRNCGMENSTQNWGMKNSTQNWGIKNANPDYLVSEEEMIKNPTNASLLKMEFPEFSIQRSNEKLYQNTVEEKKIPLEPKNERNLNTKIKKEPSKFVFSPSNLLKTRNPRKFVAPTIYRLNNLKQYDETNNH